MARGRFGVGRVIARSFAIWGRNIVPFSLLGVLAYAPVLVYAILAFPARASLADDPWRMVRYVMVIMAGWCLFWFLTPLAVIHGVLEELRGARASFLGCLRVFLTRVFPALGVGVIVGILVLLCTMACSMAAGIFAAAGLPGPVMALLSFVLPVFVACMYWVAVPVAAVERRGLLGSLHRSAELTRGARARIFVLLLFDVALLVAPWLVMRAGLGPGPDPVAGWVALALMIVFGVYGAVATAVAYHELRVAKEGVGVEQLARVFA